VLRSALEERWGVKLDPECALWPWMVEFASVQLNRGEVGADGKTAHERCKGKRGRLYGVEFGEGILWRRRPIAGALGKLTCLWEDGILLGVKANTGEFIVGGKGDLEVEVDSEEADGREVGREERGVGDRSAVEDK
jgi:hypothetical protein